MSSLLARCLLALVRAYQFLLSPWIGGGCRYWPTCSDYAIEAIGSHGVFAGVWLTLKRLGQCHPWGCGGYDPVPERTHGAPESCRRSNRTAC